MSFRFPWQSLSGKLPRDDVNKLAVELERRLQAIEMNFDTVEPVVGAPSFRRLYVPTEESTTSASYTSLATPDQVFNVPMPTGGYIYVSYQAMWKESAGQAARAAIFLNGNQLKVARSGDASPVTTAAAFGGTGGAPGQYAPLATAPYGLIGASDDGTASAYSGDVTTGQMVGVYVLNIDPGRQAAFEINGSRITTSDSDFFYGGACLVFAAAGNYTVGVRFKTSSGTVTAKERKLAVWTVGAASGQPA